MRTRSKAKIGAAGLGAIVLSLGVALPAFADYAPSPTDVVGVGGDTPQFDLAFGANGDTAGDLGFNSTNPINKLITFNATADGNARAAYADGSTLTAPLLLDPTITLRAGESPVQRPQSSGAALTALLADTGKQEQINFVFSASEPTAAQQQQAVTNGWKGLHVVQIGDDAVQMVAADPTTNAPAGLSLADVLGIYKGTYTKWSDLPDDPTGSNQTIVPLLPPSSSSITKTFLAELATANGGTAPTLSSSVKTVEQNDPSAITGNASAANAIVPFSSARLKLYDSGYFKDPTVPFGSPVSTIKPGVAAITGKNALSVAVDHYVIFRQSDLSLKTPMEPGGSLNWAETLFSNTGGTPPFFARANGKALVAAAGATAHYADLGLASSG